MGTLEESLQSFHNQMFSSFMDRTQTNDIIDLENLLNLLANEEESTVSSEELIKNKDLQGILEQEAFNNAKKLIRDYLRATFPEIEAQTANQSGDWGEAVVAALGQLLKSYDLKQTLTEVNDMGIVGKEQRIRYLPEKIAGDIITQVMNVEKQNNITNWGEVIKNLNDTGFVVSAPVQAKVDVDFAKITAGVEVNIESLQRILSYKISVKVHEGAQSKLEDINIWAAIVGCYAQAYGINEEIANKIVLFYNKRNSIMESLLTHGSHIAMLEALAGYSGIQRSGRAVYLPDLLVGYNRSSKKWKVVSVASLIEKISGSKNIFERKHLENAKVTRRIMYNFNTGKFSQTSGRNG